jgi:hypothetical protein
MRYRVAYDILAEGYRADDALTALVLRLLLPE